MVRDAVGSVRADGDTVTIVEDLTVTGSATSIKAGTTVRTIRLLDGVGEHDIDAKVDGFDPAQLKSGVVTRV